MDSHATVRYFRAVREYVSRGLSEWEKQGRKIRPTSKGNERHAGLPLNGKAGVMQSPEILIKKAITPEYKTQGTYYWRNRVKNNKRCLGWSWNKRGGKQGDDGRARGGEMPNEWGVGLGKIYMYWKFGGKIAPKERSQAPYREASKTIG